MKIIKIIGAIFGWLGMVIAGMAGGQGKTGGKAPRRFGLPLIAIGTAIGYDGFQWRDLVFLLLIPVLIMGYGQNSFIMGLIGVEWLVRVVYALILSAPFAFFGLWRWVWAAGLLIAAFSVHAGSLGQINGFGDILIEDILRYGVLGGLVLFNVFFARRKKP